MVKKRRSDGATKRSRDAKERKLNDGISEVPLRKARRQEGKKEGLVLIKLPSCIPAFLHSLETYPESLRTFH